MAFQVNAELSELVDNAIDVKFPYHQGAIDAIRENVPGRRFIDASKGGPLWRVPQNLQTGRMLRETFGDYLVLGPKLRAWGIDAKRKEQTLRALATADDADLVSLPGIMPELSEFFHPYQRADVMMMAQNNILNANQPGLGKTVETIGAIFESGLHRGGHLVLAPKTSLEVVWQYELERWQEYPVYMLSGDIRPAERADMLRKCKNLSLDDRPFWLICNHDMIRREAGLLDINWKTATIDEYHKVGLATLNSVFEKNARKLTTERRYLISGTPMGGKAIKLWGGLHWLDPKEFSSKWAWAERWLEVVLNDAGHKEIGAIKEGMEDEFYEYHAQWIVRRLKSEVLKQLPPKQHIDVWCKMTPKQEKQYKTFAADAEVKIDEHNLSATSILAEYTRLKQFADALCTVEVGQRDCTRCNGTGQMEQGSLAQYYDAECDLCQGSGQMPLLTVVPTDESGKLPQLMEILDERGLSEDGIEGDQQVIVVSQFKKMIDMVCDHLNSKGIPAAKITGAISQKERSSLVRSFQDGSGPRVMCLVTSAGGVSITLDRADTVVVLDETWDPGDQEQVEDRAHRASRIHQVTIYNLRTKGTIEETIMQMGISKAAINEDILDLRRQGFKATAAL